MENCVFCKILNKEIPDYTFWENEDAFAFLDITPKVIGHSLVVPKKHIDYIFDLSDEELAKLMAAAKKIAKVLKDFTGKKRVCVIVEGFAVPHVHVHLIPADNEKEFTAPALPADHAKLRELQIKVKEFVG